MNIGIFAGTFDPIHNGHLAFARQAIAEAKLDKVIIVAEKEPYRKAPFTSWDHRQAMIERSTSGIKNVDHDYSFAAALSKQHTLKDTLGHAHAHYGEAARFWFLVGSDVFEHMHAWKDIVSSSEYAGFVMALRDGHTIDWVTEKSEALNITKDQIILISNQEPHISSSKIRTAITNKEITNDIPEAVADYIQNHQLYKKQN